MFRKIFFLLFLALASSASAALPSAEEIRDIVQPFVDKGHVVGVAVGIITPEGKRIYGFGETAKGSGIRPDGDTLFEAGSISKIFTCLLLEDEVLRGRVRMDDPVTQFLPPDMPFPKYKDPFPNFSSKRYPQPQVTLWHLATHTSGFPFMPGEGQFPRDWKKEDPSYVTLDMIRDFYSRFSFERPPGAQYEYANFNISFLGYFLSLREKTDLETLLNERILDPLGLKDTRITLSPSQRKRLAQGYDEHGNPAMLIHTPIPLAGAGSLKSTVNDLLRFESINFGLAKGPLDEAIRRQQQPVPATVKGPRRTIAYFYYTPPEGEILLVRSRTLGFRGCLGMIPSRKIGVVILGNFMKLDTPEIFRRMLATALSAQNGGKRSPSLEKISFEGLDQ